MLTTFVAVNVLLLATISFGVAVFVFISEIEYQEKTLCFHMEESYINVYLLNKDIFVLNLFVNLFHLPLDLDTMFLFFFSGNKPS